MQLALNQLLKIHFLNLGSEVNFQFPMDQAGKSTSAIQGIHFYQSLRFSVFPLIILLYAHP